MNLKNLLFDEQSKLVCTPEQHRKKCNDSSLENHRLTGELLQIGGF